MHISTAEVLVSNPGRNFVTMRITTDDGVVGLGDATLNGRELAVAAYLSEHVAPLLIGRDAHLIEDTWQYLYRGAYWRRGPVTMAAVAAVDTALWDIKAKVAGLPLYQLLGGRSRSGLLAYGHASGMDLPELFGSIRDTLAEGYRAIRVQTGVPGLPSVYGVASSENASVGEGRYDYEPARRGEVPVEERWDTAAYLRHIPTVLEAVRGEFGPELPLLHDAHHRLTPIQAARLGKAVEPYDLFWLEDVTPAENQAALRRVREHTTTPLAIGEVFNTIWDYRECFEEQLIDYVRSSVTHAGGITALRRIFDYAAVYQIKSGVHGPTDVSPVGLAAAIHLGIAIPNFGIQEYMRHSPATHELFRPGYTFADGMLTPGEAPGLGVDYDDEIGQAHPYQRAYLPVNRLTDGTMHDW
jgi:mannonate dehydratase